MRYFFSLSVPYFSRKSDHLFQPSNQIFGLLKRSILPTCFQPTVSTFRYRPPPTAAHDGSGLRLACRPSLSFVRSTQRPEPPPRFQAAYTVGCRLARLRLSSCQEILGVFHILAGLIF
jgi:hypothetical protein